MKQGFKTTTLKISQKYLMAIKKYLQKSNQPENDVKPISLSYNKKIEIQEDIK